MVADRNDAWNLRTPEGTVYGPVSKSQLDHWVREGRVTSDCAVQTPPAGDWQRADIVYPALQEPSVVTATSGGYPRPLGHAGEVVPEGAAPGASGTNFRGPSTRNLSTANSGRVFLQPHRGALILVMALVGLVVQCPVFSLLAWVLGSSDLTEMREGRMDPAGEPATRAGRLIGMLLVFIWGIIFSVSAVAGLLMLVVRR